MNNEWRKIIFLDIDGCVNSEDWFVKTKGRKGNFDPDVINLLNTLKDCGAEVVVSSSWGEDGVEQLKNVGLELPILGITDHVRHKAEWVCRGNEIEKWLLDNFGGMGTAFGKDSNGVPYHRHTDTDYEYVIFDDDANMLLGQKDNFVHINRMHGITESDIEKAKNILVRL